MTDQVQPGIGFSAEGRKPSLPPPVTTSGPIAWIRDNLLSSPLNIALTVISLAVLAWIIPSLLQWAIFDAVVSAGSKRECDALGSGACWAIVVERFNQFLFGFYPSDQRWRPILAFVLLFPALMPLLFTELPHRGKLMLFSALFPFIAYYLIWGGSIWAVVAVVAAPIAGLIIFQVISGASQGGLTLAALALAVLGVIFWLMFLIHPIDDQLTRIAGPVGLPAVESAKLGGFLLTVIIGVTGIVASLPLGIVLALGRQSNLLVLKSLSIVFIEFIRGVPLITLLFVASTLLAYFLPPGTTFDLLLRVVIMVTLFSSAYIAEVVRGGLAAIPKGQYEAGDAMGLHYWQKMRLIILPQALKVSIPGIVNTFIGLFKDTTLVSIIGLLDPLGIVQPILADAKWIGLSTELYVFIALFYFVSCFSMSRYSMWLEGKLDTGHRS